MLRFFKRHTALFALLPLIHVAGNAFEPLSYLLVIGIMGVWMARGKDRLLLILLLFILVMGDSRAYFFLYFKNLRIIAILLVGLRTFLLIGQGKAFFSRLLYLTIPFFFIATIGIFLSPVKGTAFAKMFSYFLLLVIALSWFPYLFRRYKEEILLDLVGLISWVLALGLLAYFTSPYISVLGYRYRGILGNPNGLGIYCTLAFVITFMIMHLVSQKRSLIWTAMGLIVLSVLMSNSRTALGTIGIFGMLHFFYKGGGFRKASLWLFFLPLGAFVLSVFSLEDLVGMIGLSDYLRVESLADGTGRFLAWQMGWTEILNNPLIGKGFAYEEWFYFNLRDFFYFTEHQGGMHNSYLTFIMNNGFIGFFFFLIFLIAMFRKTNAPGFAFPFIIMALISANFESWLNSSLNAFSIHFYFIMVMLMRFPMLQSWQFKEPDHPEDS